MSSLTSIDRIFSQAVESKAMPGIVACLPDGLTMRLHAPSRFGSPPVGDRCLF